MTNRTGAGTNGADMATPLTRANVHYDQLATRLGFKRQPGTRERLVGFLQCMVHGDSGSAHRHFLQFGLNQQKALTNLAIQGGSAEMRNLLEQIDNPVWTNVVICGVSFDFYEEV